ncbi:hypothetical protein GCM10009731_37870 [Streptomyces globosus]
MDAATATALAPYGEAAWAGVAGTETVATATMRKKAHPWGARRPAMRPPYGPCLSTPEFVNRDPFAFMLNSHRFPRQFIEVTCVTAPDERPLFSDVRAGAVFGHALEYLGWVKERV